MRCLYLTTFSVLCMLITGCSESEPPTPPPLEIPVVEVKQQDVPIILDMVGQTRGSKDIPIRARVDGILESLNFLEGRPVEEGQLLYTIETRPFDAKLAEAKSYLAEARTGRVKAKSDLDRIRPLAEINAVSQQDLDSAVAKFDAAVASVQAAQAQVEQAKIELGYTNIHAPITGRIGISQAKVGEYVGREPNPIVLNYVSKNDPIRVRFSINERDYLRIARKFIKRMDEFEKLESSEKSRLEVQGVKEDEGILELILADGTVHDHKGKIINYEAAIDPSTGTLTLEADFPNPDRLVLAGQFARVRSVIQVRKNVLLIPQRAMAELQGKFQVFVVNADGIIEVREVTPGPKFENFIIIEQGIKFGEDVATEGLLRLRNGMKIVAKEMPSIEKNKSDLDSSTKHSKGG